MPDISRSYDRGRQHSPEPEVGGLPVRNLGPCASYTPPVVAIEA